ncbi:MAG: hypothetical protein Tsb0013_11430 [Phycisphaerales bacterium]
MHPDVILLLAALKFLLIWLPATLAAVCFVFAWRGDPSKGRRRCRRCWHAMDALPKTDGGWTCPECGHRTTKEQHLYRAAPRKWLQRIYLALLLIAPLPWYTSVVIDRWPREGKAALIPTTLAALCYPRHVQDIRTRGSLGYKIDQLLHDRSCPNGDCDDLHPFYRWLAGTPEYDFAWYDPMDHVDLPKAWVRGEPIPVGLERLMGHAWSQPNFVQRSVFIARGETAFGSVVWPDGTGGGRVWTFQHRDRSPIVLPATKGERARFSMRVGLVVRPSSVGDGLRYARSSFTDATIDIPLVDTWEEALSGAVQSPAHDHAIDRWLLETSQLHFYQVSGYIFLTGPDRAVFEFGASGVPFDVNLVYDIVLMDGEEELHRETVGQSWRIRDRWKSPPDELGLRILGADDAAFQDNLDRMTVRLVPRPRLALTQFTHDTYWMPADGSAYLEMTLREALAVPQRQGAGFTTTDLLNPPAPFVRQLPW